MGKTDISQKNTGKIVSDAYKRIATACDDYIKLLSEKKQRHLQRHILF